MESLQVITMAHGQGGAEIGFDRGPTLTCNHEAPIAAYGIRTANTSSNGWGIQEEATHTLDRAMGIAVAHTLKAEGFDASEDGTGRGTPLVPVHCPDLHPTLVAFPANMSGTQYASAEDIAPSMGAKNPTAVAFNMHKSGNEASSLSVSEDRTDCLRAFEKSPFAVQPAAGMQVRRLTPVECERLQGFPDNYTAIPWRGKTADQCPDGPRYKALGNSWAVPNVRWIGLRIHNAVLAARENLKEAA